MKRKSKTPVKMVSALTVLFTFLLLIALFRVEKSVISQDEKAVQLFSLMPQSERVPHLIESEARDELDDPTIMSLPNLKYGFSQVRIGEGEPPKPQLPIYLVPALELPQVERVRVPLVGIYNEPGLADGEFLARPELLDFEIESGAETLSKRVIWLEDGQEKLCPLKLEDIQSTSKGILPKGATKVQIEQFPEGPAVFLVNKCGVPALDGLILTYVRDQLKNLFLEKIKASDLPGEIYVDWQLVIETKSDE